MRTAWRFVLSMLLVTVLFLAAALMNLRAAEPGGPPLSSSVPTAAPGPQPSRPSPSRPTAPAAVATPVTPSVPEESATVSDDPTTAPDAAQSADHAVSLPTDI